MKSRIPALLTFVGVVACGSTALWWLWTGSQAAVPEPANEVAEESDGTAVSPDRILLPEGKAKVLELRLAEVTRRSLQPTSTVPARLQYDDRRHVEVRVAAPGILTDVLVRPGDHVEAGQVLAVVSSPEVGHARADVMQSEADLQLAQERLDWEQTSYSGLLELAAAIEQRSDSESIRERFHDVPLGSVRQTLLTAYSELLLAERMAETVAGQTARDALSERVVRERLSERDTTAATLAGLLEQSQFDAKQRCRTARNLVEDAQRRLDLRRQNVRTLLGQAEAVPSPLKIEKVAAGNVGEGADLSHVNVKAPFAGTIEGRTFSPAERVEPGDAIFVLANTETLWVAADLREREWTALGLQPGDEIQLSSPGRLNESLVAQVYFVGREVDPQTNAVPLIAEVENRDGLLRPGMFTQATIPTGESIETLAVPSSAIVEHEGATFVFVPQGDREYQRIDIITGRRADQFVEVVSGLSEGQQVVASDAFYLKSELLLEGEE